MRGKYQHFKGGLYWVEGTAVHTETQEEMVVYRKLGGDERYVRPKAVFEETVQTKRGLVPRFIKVRVDER